MVVGLAGKFLALEQYFGQGDRGPYPAARWMWMEVGLYPWLLSVLDLDGKASYVYQDHSQRAFFRGLPIEPEVRRLWIAVVQVVILAAYIPGTEGNLSFPEGG